MEEMAGMVLKAGDTAVSVMALLDKANRETYGEPEITMVKTGVRKNPGILISGHDLLDLAELLEQTKGTGVDVYTHSEMLPAHYYPYFKKFDNLAGNVPAGKLFEFPGGIPFPRPFTDHFLRIFAVFYIFLFFF